MIFKLPGASDEKEARLSEWHRWFAWRPVVTTSRDLRWLEIVERRGVKVTVHEYDAPDWEYWHWTYRPAQFKGLLP